MRKASSPKIYPQLYIPPQMKSQGATSIFYLARQWDRVQGSDPGTISSPQSTSSSCFHNGLQGWSSEGTAPVPRRPKTGLGYNPTSSIHQDTAMHRADAALLGTSELVSWKSYCSKIQALFVIVLINALDKVGEKQATERESLASPSPVLTKIFSHRRAEGFSDILNPMLWIRKQTVSVLGLTPSGRMSRISAPKQISRGNPSYLVVPHSALSPGKKNDTSIAILFSHQCQACIVLLHTHAHMHAHTLPTHQGPFSHKLITSEGWKTECPTSYRRLRVSLGYLTSSASLGCQRLHLVRSWVPSTSTEISSSL